MHGSRATDPLWLMDVAVAAEWVGAWWSAALRSSGVDDVHVHAGKSEPGEFGDLVCFAGRGPGEVFAGQRKLVGLSQWRAREGALFSSCVYRRWEPDALAALFVTDERRRARRATVPVVVTVAPAAWPMQCAGLLSGWLSCSRGRLGT